MQVLCYYCGKVVDSQIFIMNRNETNKLNDKSVPQTLSFGICQHCIRKGQKHLCKIVREEWIKAHPEEQNPQKAKEKRAQRLIGLAFAGLGFLFILFQSTHWGIILGFLGLLVAVLSFAREDFFHFSNNDIEETVFQLANVSPERFVEFSWQCLWEANHLPLQNLVEVGLFSSQEIHNMLNHSIALPRNVRGKFGFDAYFFGPNYQPHPHFLDKLQNHYLGFLNDVSTQIRNDFFVYMPDAKKEFVKGLQNRN